MSIHLLLHQRGRDADVIRLAREPHRSSHESTGSGESSGVV
jgi:hypothetical protein